MEEVSFVPGLEGWQHIDGQRDQGGQRLRGGKNHGILGNRSVVKGSKSQLGERRVEMGTYLPLGWKSHCCRRCCF